MFRIGWRRLVLTVVVLSVSACGAGATAATQSVRPSAPTYAQVLSAIAGAQSVHSIAGYASNATADVTGDATGSLLGKETVPGVGTLQFYVRLSVNTNGTAGASIFDAIYDAGFVAHACARCHLTPNVCYAFSPAMQQKVGLNPTGLTNVFTAGGFAKQLSTLAPIMTVQGTTVVDEQPVYVFKGYGRELDLPFGSRLPLRYVHTGVENITFSEWGSAGPITKPASCVHPRVGT